MALGESPERSEDPQFIMVPLSNDPERMAEALIADSLPIKFLDEIDISNEQGMAELIARLSMRQHQASLEKDEIVRFTQHNEQALRAGFLQLLAAMVNASKKMEGGEGLGRFIAYFLEQIQYVLNGEPDKIDIKSDRLLWLLYALGLSVSDGAISYAEGLRILNKKEHRDRISRLSIAFMFKDFINYIGSPQQTSVEYIMFISECAFMTEDIAGASTGLVLLGYLDPPNDIVSWLDLISRLSAFLEKNGKLRTEDRAFVQKVFLRYRQEVSEDDF